MAKAKVKDAVVSEIPADVLGAVVLADLAQIEADAATHQDEFAKARILKAVNRLRQIATGVQPEIEAAPAA